MKTNAFWGIFFVVCFALVISKLVQSCVDNKGPQSKWSKHSYFLQRSVQQEGIKQTPRRDTKYWDLALCGDTLRFIDCWDGHGVRHNWELRNGVSAEIPTLSDLVKLVKCLGISQIDHKNEPVFFVWSTEYGEMSLLESHHKGYTEFSLGTQRKNSTKVITTTWREY